MDATETDIESTERLDVAKPKKYQVIMFNDDQTPMEFVIELLVGIFRHTEQAAEDITVKIHNEGKEHLSYYLQNSLENWFQNHL